MTRPLANLTHTLRLRPAALADRENLFHWRNHERIREASLDTAPIPWEAHCAWLERTLSHPNRALLIGELPIVLPTNATSTTPITKPPGVPYDPIGVLRYDMTIPEAVVSIYLLPDKIGQGFGVPLLNAGSHWIKQAYPSIERIVATIRPENQASIHTFTKAGYCLISENPLATPLDSPPSSLAENPSSLPKGLLYEYRF